MELVGWHLGIPSSEVYGAATSYTELRIEKPGEHVLRVCTGLSCRINGGAELLAAAEAEVEEQSVLSSSGDIMTLEETACGFLCGMAPAVEMDGIWMGRVDSDSVTALIREVAAQ